MSIEINHVVLGGNLTRDVELKELAGGQKVCTFSVACNRTYMREGQKVTETSYVDVDVWGAMGENCQRYLHKGSPVVVVGRIKQDRWESSAGEKRSKLKVVAANVQFLSSGRSGSDRGGVDASQGDDAWAGGWEG